MAKVNLNLKKKTRKPKVYKKSKSLTKTQKKEVESLIHKQDETKYAFHTLTSDNTLLMFNSVISATGDMCQVIPNVSKGTGGNNRIGDELLCQRLKIQGHIRYSPFTGVDDPGRGNIAVRLMLVSNKLRPNFPDVQGSLSPLNSLLKKGGTTTNFSGLLSDLYADINREIWTVHKDKIYYLTQPSIIRTQGGVSGAVSTVSMDFSNVVKFFSIDAKVRRKFIYDDSINGGLTPTNAGPILLLGYVYLNAATPDSVSTNVGLYYTSTMEFEG